MMTSDVNTATVSGAAPVVAVNPRVSVGRKKLKQLQKELNGAFYERGKEIEGLVVAVLAGQHVLLMGDPGTGKSALASTFAKSFEGNYFPWLLTKFSTPEELFGPVSMSGLLQDRYERNTSGKLPEADFAFLDEIFKANSSILNSLLTVLNEKLFYNNGSPVKVSLQTLIGASNELPEDSSLNALFDRFVLRYWPVYIQDSKNLKSLLLAQSEPSVSVQISTLELQAMQAAAMAVDFPASTADSLLDLRDKLSKEGIHASDRRWRQLVKVLKAYAFLQGEDEVSEEHFAILSAALWNKPEEIEKIELTLRQLGNQISMKVDQLLVSAKEAYDTFQGVDMAELSGPGVASLTQGQLESMLNELSSLSKKAKGSSARKIANAEAKIKGYVEAILQKVSALYGINSGSRGF